MKRYKISVHKHGSVGADDEHIVRVEIHEGDREIGTYHLPGGDFQNAKAMGEDLRNLANGGFDLEELLPDSSVEDCG